MHYACDGAVDDHVTEELREAIDHQRLSAHLRTIVDEGIAYIGVRERSIGYGQSKLLPADREIHFNILKLDDKNDENETCLCLL